MQADNNRLYSLDYLRVLAIGVLFFYHFLMIWVPDWGFHFKQETQMYWLQHLMLVVSPWRMSILWFISGAAIVFMMAKHSTLNLLAQRTLYLLIPLLFGILFIVPIQLYVEMTSQGAFELGVGQFFFAFYIEPSHHFKDYQAGIWPHIDVNHLWYLRSLWRYSILILIIYPVLRTIIESKRVIWLSVTITLLLLNISANLFVEGEQKREVSGLLWMLIGVICAQRGFFWQILSKYTSGIVVITTVSMLVLQCSLFWMNQQLFEQYPAPWQTLLMFNYALAKTLSVLAILALANRYLNKEQAVITKLNPYVFPLYVIHQSVIIFVAYFVSQLGMNTWVDMLLTLIIALSLCLLVLLACRRSYWLGLLLGKFQKSGSERWSAHKIALMVICIPLILRLLSLY